MSLSIWLSFLIYTTTTALTPGPNNILALTTTSKYGISKSRKLLFGIYSGFLCVMILCSMLGMVLSNRVPEIMKYMKYIGVVYILWLSIHVIRSKPLGDNEEEIKNSPSFFTGFLLQFLNVKIILFGFMIFLSYIFPHYQDRLMLLGFAVLISVIGNSATHIWALSGSMFSTNLQDHWRIVNCIMGGLLLYSAISLLLS